MFVKFNFEESQKVLEEEKDLDSDSGEVVIVLEIPDDVDFDAIAFLHFYKDAKKRICNYLDECTPPSS